MKLFLNCLLLLLISNMVSNNNITNSTDCKEIKPTKPSDCVLSDADKKKILNIAAMMLYLMNLIVILLLNQAMKL